MLQARELLGSASRLRFTNDAGSDVTYEYGGYKLHEQYGFSDESGRCDHFASAMVNTVADDGAVNGTVVFQPGDILFPYKRYFSKPVRLDIRDGAVREMFGGVDAVLIRDYLALFDDDRGHQVSHIGWVMDERARWDAVATGSPGIGIDARSYLGSVMFSTGPNVEFGGRNDTSCHMDMPMHNCSLWLDNTLIIDRGRVLDPALRLRVPFGASANDRASTIGR